MSVLIYRDAKTVGTCAATMLAAHILQNPKSVIGVDYHENLLPVYDSLSQMTENGLLNWNDSRIYQLFEFLVDDSGEHRIANLLGKALFSKLDLNSSNYVVPHATEKSAKEAADAFETDILNQGGLDAALIAVRQDGSLLMNHAADDNPYTHEVTGDGNGFITVGIASLMQTKHPIVVALGSGCAEAVRIMLHGSLTESPLAALKLHPHATFILDEEAAVML